MGLDFTGHRIKSERLTFSERQRLRKSNALLDDPSEQEAQPVFPIFKNHKVKHPSKLTFSDRQKQRKLGELEEENEGAAIIGHRVKDRLTFSEMQRIRRQRKIKEEDPLDFIDGIYDGTWSGYTSDSPHADVSDYDSPGTVDLLEEETDSHESRESQKQRPSFRINVKLGSTGKKLLSGAIAGGVSRTVVAPLETIRTHMMVGKGQAGRSIAGVFTWIMETEGWPGLFRGNGINVLRVAPSKAIELFTYETVKKALTPRDGSAPPFPIASVAGSSAGIASCTLMYPLELVKTRLTVQPGQYRGILHAFTRIITEEGPKELYRGLLPSIIGVIPYAGSNYYAYDTLRTAYKRITKKERIGNVATLCIGSTAGAFAAMVTFPLEVARKQMQVGALSSSGAAYKGTLDCIRSIVRDQGPGGLYRGLVPSCVKLMPAAGISFMCYEALKQILRDEEEARADERARKAGLSKATQTK